MSILGHGIDLIELQSVRLYADMPDWQSRIFTEQEIANFPVGPTRLAHIAGRFAAKEAVLKAIGTGYGNGVAFTDVVINRIDGAVPTVTLTKGVLSSRLNQIQNTSSVASATADRKFLESLSYRVATRR